MKKKISLKLLLIFIIFSISLIFFFFKTLASPGLTCELKNVGAGNPCNPADPNEICLFSLNLEANSHAGDCSYGNWKVCCDDPDPGLVLTPDIRSTPCTGANEDGVVKLFDTSAPYSNSHVDDYDTGTFTTNVCLHSTAGQVQCGIGPCVAGETCVVKLYKSTNSHACSCTSVDPNCNIEICCGYGGGSVCGDDTVEPPEECELPDTTDNTYCNCPADDCYDADSDGNNDDLVDYPDYGDCLSDCSCDLGEGTGEPCEPILVSYDDPICTAPVCGDDTVEPPEECELPDTTDNTYCNCPADDCYDYDGEGDTLDRVDYPDYGDCLSDCSCDLGEGTGEPCEPIPPIIWDDPTCGCTSDGVCQPYEKCDCDDPACTWVWNPQNDKQCKDFRDKCTGCFYYDWCECGYHPDDIDCPAMPGTTCSDCSLNTATPRFCSSNWDYYCYSVDTPSATIHEICEDITAEPHVRMACDIP